MLLDTFSLILGNTRLDPSETLPLWIAIFWRIRSTGNTLLANSPRKCITFRGCRPLSLANWRKIPTALTDPFRTNTIQASNMVYSDAEGINRKF